MYGIATIDTLLPLVIEEIERTTEYRLDRGNKDVSFQAIRLLLKDLEPLAAAAITCKVTVDRVFAKTTDENKQPNGLAKVSEGIGQAVEDELQMRHYEREAPGLLHTIKENYWHRSCGTQQRLTLTQTLMNRYDVPPWRNWGSKNRVKIGAWLLDCLCKSSGWFTITKIKLGNKTPAIVVPTAEFLSIKEQVIANSELFSPEAWPMLVEPNDWSAEHPGGYLLNEVMRGHNMVRRADHHPIQGETIYEFLNSIQKVAYTLNPFIVSVAETLYERGHSVGKFIPVWHEEEPPKPPDIEDNEQSRMSYRRAKAEWHNRQNDNAQKSVRTRKIMEAVERFKKYDRWYLPWSLDYRGRAYPIPAFLTPQDTDFGKSLIRFAEESYVTPDSEGWLAFQVATTFGLDKKSMADRQQWVKDNQAHIIRVATDPIGNIGDWECADEPWLFLAACEEYYAVLIDCSRHYTGLPIAVDATCSGMQILAGLARDESTARYVNVLPSEKPQDAYRAVAELALPEVPQWLQEYVDRSVAKRLVMTIPYSAKFKSNWGYVKEALEDKGLTVEKEDVTATTHALRNAVFELFPGPTEVMTWIEKEIALKIKEGATQIEWTTPSGFHVVQKFMKPHVEQLDLQVLGRVRMNVAVGDSDEVDLNHHRNASSPNLIHSADATILHFTATRFPYPLTLIHDSVLCRATDMGRLSDVVREVYMELFAHFDYLKDWARQIGAQSEPPIIGTLDPSQVIESTYFFC